MTELINDWNGFMDVQLNERDLSQPTFEFFYNALLAIMEKLNYDVEEIKADIPEHDRERLFRIKLVHYIAELYKLSNPAHNFYYIDLIRPSEYFFSLLLLRWSWFIRYIDDVFYCRQEKMCARAENIAQLLHLCGHDR